MTTNTRPPVVTFSGKILDAANPDPSLICIEDVAQGLARRHRYNGLTKVPYSVAQHSCIVSQMVAAPHRLGALMHDAAEAYLVDLPSPFKAVCPEFCALEKVWMAAIEKGLYGLGQYQSLVVEPIHAADLEVRKWEIWELCLNPEAYGLPRPPALPCIPDFVLGRIWDVEEAATNFLSYWKAYTTGKPTGDSSGQLIK